MSRGMVLVMAILGMMAAAVAVQWPEIQRYLKVRKM
jgi:type II secretory pathway pseudopilin PulG